MAKPFQCGHGIALDSYCNACAQAAKLTCIHSIGRRFGRLLCYKLLRRLDAERQAVHAEAGAVVAKVSYAPFEYQESEVTRDAGLKAIADLNGWRTAALESLLLQAEANQRILYLESVMADILDADFRLRYPFLASKIETALYPPVM